MKKQLLLFALLLVSNGILQAIVFDSVLPVKSTSTESLVELTRPLNTVDTNLKIPFNSGLDVETYFKYIGSNYIPVRLKFNLYAKSKSNPDFGVKLITSQEVTLYDPSLDEHKLHLHADSLKMLTVGSYELYVTYTTSKYIEDILPGSDLFNKLDIEIMITKKTPILEIKELTIDIDPWVGHICMYNPLLFNFVIENIGDTDYYGSLILTINDENGYCETDTLAEKMVNIPTGRTVKETMEGSIKHHAYECIIKLLYQNNEPDRKLEIMTPTEMSIIPLFVHNPMSLPKNSSDAAINIYPNPVTDWVEIETNTPIQKINITSSQGITIIEQKESETIKTRVETKSLAPGNYIIQIQTDNSIISRQFIKY